MKNNIKSDILDYVLEVIFLTKKNIKEKNNKFDFKKIKDKTINSLSSIKQWSKNYMSTNILFMTFVLTSLINSYLIRFFTVKNYFNLKPIVADFAVILIIGAFGYLFKPKNQYNYFFALICFLAVLFTINSIYFFCISISCIKYIFIITCVITF